MRRTTLVIVDQHQGRLSRESEGGSECSLAEVSTLGTALIAAASEIRSMPLEPRPNGTHGAVIDMMIGKFRFRLLTEDSLL